MRENLVIIFGGHSRESLVSVATAQNLSQALPEASCWFWALDGQIYDVSREHLLSHADAFKVPLIPQKAPLFESLSMALHSELAFKSLFINGLHGGSGEDGTVQYWFEKRYTPFTGPGSEACRACMNKDQAKQKLKAAGARVAESYLISGYDDVEAEASIRKLFQSFDRLILKPNEEGSSFGLLLLEPSNWDQALREISKNLGTSYLLEAYIPGTELTVGVVDSKSGTRALVPTELRVQRGFADYDGKYLGLGTVEVTPAQVSAHVIEMAQRLAVAAHTVLNCEGYSRTDMIVDQQGVVFLETNALPGLTKASLVPQALAYEGVSLREFLEEQMEIARVRARRTL
ncbi:MAG: ATP-grasp domain-containing protein [Myxococcaceae bacterium]|nr:ATP-grasp domain-containing protein [Myxococcaceae bacterium]MBH2006079.1 ATP-grasp domain-containing protein [Myxococcaceae bacterium]